MWRLGRTVNIQWLSYTYATVSRMSRTHRRAPAPIHHISQALLDTTTPQYRSAVLKSDWRTNKIHCCYRWQASVAHSGGFYWYSCGAIIMGR